MTQVCMCVIGQSLKSQHVIPELNQMITHRHLKVSNEYDFEGRTFPEAPFHVGHAGEGYRFILII